MQAFLANAVESGVRASIYASTQDEGEIWISGRGCRVSVRGDAVVGMRLLEGGPLVKGSATPGPALAAALGQVAEYLQGTRLEFNIKIFIDGPPFYRKVWETLRQIPYGKTLSYGELAALSGSPGSARAVGSAMRKNPLVLIVPCHRVVGSGGKLGGFSCGTAWKKYLLELEGRAGSLEFVA